MAMCRLDFRSAAVKMATNLYLALPDPNDLRQDAAADRKVLYLLHGLSDDCSVWLRNTRAEMFAQKYGIVVVMPQVARSFYCDLPHEINYFQHVTEEIPDYLHRLLGLRRDREHNFVAGLSMGGYGALKCALNLPERFFACGSFSGLTAFHEAHLLNGPSSPEEMGFVFGVNDLHELVNSRHDPLLWLEQQKDNPLLPPLYQACGTSDFLLDVNHQFRDRCRELSVPLHYEEGPGAHEWYFWDRHLERFLAWALEQGCE